MSGKNKSKVWKHEGVAERDDSVPNFLDISAEVKSGSRMKMFTCPVCTKPLTYRIWSSVKMDAICPNCRIAVLILKPSQERLFTEHHEAVPVGTLPARKGRPFKNLERRHG